jgi:hypothetical protein
MGQEKGRSRPGQGSKASRAACCQEAGKSGKIGGFGQSESSKVSQGESGEVTGRFCISIAPFIFNGVKVMGQLCWAICRLAQLAL